MGETDAAIQLLQHPAVTPCLVMYSSTQVPDEAESCAQYVASGDLSGPVVAANAAVHEAWRAVLAGAAITPVPLRVFSWGVELSQS